MFRTFQIWLQSLRLFVRHVPVLDREPDWTEHDAESLARWMKTEAGRKYRRILANNQAKANRAATLPRGEAQYSCGFAAGYSAGASLMDTLAAVGQPESAEQNIQPVSLGGKELAEVLAP